MRLNRLQPANHPSVQRLLAGHLPSGHPDCDVVLRNPLQYYPLPRWHPPLSWFIRRRTSSPTVLPTHAPVTQAPTPFPTTASPTLPPTNAPTSTPTLAPTAVPTGAPTTRAPTSRPTSAPTFTQCDDGTLHCDNATTYCAVIDARGTARCVCRFGHLPITGNTTACRLTSSPTGVPTEIPTALPTTVPSAWPTLAPTSSPTAVPTSLPTALPSAIPSASPTSVPTTLAPTSIAPTTPAPTRRPGRPRIIVPVWHPNPMEMFALNASLPLHHPNVSELVRPYQPWYHPDVDIILRSLGDRDLPSFHTPLDQFLERPMSESAPWGTQWPLTSISVYYKHPSASEAYARSEPYPAAHPLVHPLVNVYLPPGHINVDEALRDPDRHPLPLWHPALDDLLARRSIWSPAMVLVVAVLSIVLCAAVFRAVKRGAVIHVWSRRATRGSAGGNSNQGYATPTKGKRHIEPRVFAVNPMYEPYSTEGNSNHGESATSKGEALSTQNDGYLDVDAEDFEDADGFHGGFSDVSDGDDGSGNSSSSLDEKDGYLEVGVDDGSNVEDDAEEFDGFEDVLDDTTEATAAHASQFQNEVSEPPHRRLGHHVAMQRHTAHRAADCAYDFEPVRAPRTSVRPLVEKTAGRWAMWRRWSAGRVPWVRWRRGSVLLITAYVALNAFALLVASTYSISRGLGSLAVGNTVCLVSFSARNNVFTWILGVPFDLLLAYHRAIGRVTVAVCVAHALFHTQDIVGNLSDRVTWTGGAALLCGIIIAATTFDRVRRSFFNVFYWAHYSFAGFFVFTYLHAREGRPFLLAAISVFALDKLLRLLWTGMPSRTRALECIGERTARVVVAKNPLTRIMGRHKVGQFVYVNFPELSLTEWHPFSVSSGPAENFIELHIRALGDHTRRIVKLVAERAASNQPAWVRVDGPYGVLGLNCRRYGALVLVGAGVGMTPVLSILKDLYMSHNANETCLRLVRVVWIMPTPDDAMVFLPVLQQIQTAAASGARAAPVMQLTAHCTRAGSAVRLEAPLVPGRPNFPEVLDSVELESAKAPTLVFACGPGKMVNELWDVASKRSTRNHRVDFHAENFEF